MTWGTILVAEDPLTSVLIQTSCFSQIPHELRAKWTIQYDVNGDLSVILFRCVELCFHFIPELDL